MATQTRREGIETDPARTGTPASRRGPTFSAPGALSGRARVDPWHKLRVDPDFGEEEILWSQGLRHVAGIDEVGRGCLAGPVVAAAVILPRGWLPPGLRDSKLLKLEQRERIAAEIEARAVAWSVAFVEAEIIDRINILQATLLATQLAASRLMVRPDALLLDGTLLLPEVSVPQRVIVDADRLCASVAAASVLAKVARDRLMVALDGLYPGYDMARNKGYAAPEHRAGLEALGLSPVHRRSFGSCARVEQTTLWGDSVEPSYNPLEAETTGIEPDLPAVFDPDPAGEIDSALEPIG